MASQKELFGSKCTGRVGYPARGEFVTNGYNFSDHCSTQHGIIFSGYNKRIPFLGVHSAYSIINRRKREKQNAPKATEVSGEKNIVIMEYARTCCLSKSKVHGQLSTKKIVKLLARSEKDGYVGVQAVAFSSTEIRKSLHHLFTPLSYMLSQTNTLQEVRASLVSFDMVSRYEKGLLRMVRDDLSRMKNVTQQQRALAQCNVYRAQRTEKQIKIEFFDMNQPKESRVCFRMIYELASSDA